MTMLWFSVVLDQELSKHMSACSCRLDGKDVRREKGSVRRMGEGRETGMEGERDEG